MTTRDAVAGTVLILRWACLNEGYVHLGLLCQTVNWERRGARRTAETLVELGVLRTAGDSHGFYCLSDKAVQVLKTHARDKWPKDGVASTENKQLALILWDKLSQKQEET